MTRLIKVWLSNPIEFPKMPIESELKFFTSRDTKINKMFESLLITNDSLVTFRKTKIGH